MLRDRITDFLYTLSSNILCSKGGILLGRVTGKGRAQEITVGSGLLFVGTTLTSSSVPIQDGQLTIPKTAGLQAALDGKSSLSAVADIQVQVNQKAPLPLVMASPPVSEVLGYATASIVFSGNPLGGDSFTINGTIYTFYRGLAPFSPRDITPPMPENANNWAAAAAYAINNWRLGGPDANVTASVTGATVILTARSRGVAGNSITLSKASAVLAISGGTLTGGIPPISGTPGKAGQTAVVTVGELKTIYTCVTENPLKWDESFSERNLGANVATALAKPTGSLGAVQLVGDVLTPSAIQLPDMTGLTAPAGYAGFKNGQLAVADGVTPGGNILIPARYAGVQSFSLNGQPKSSAFIKIVGIPIPANKMVSGTIFRIAGNVIIHGNETLCESTSMTSHRLGIALLAGSTVPMGAAGAAVWLGETYSDMPQLIGSFLRHEFGGGPLTLSATNLGNTEFTIRTVNGITSMANGSNGSTGPTYVSGVANELCIMFGLQSGNAGNYTSSIFKVSYNLTLEILN